MISVANKPKPVTCWYCEKPRSSVSLRFGRAACQRCDDFLRQGVICIGVTTPLDADTFIDKIYRDGNWCVVSLEEYERRFRKEVPEHHLAFITPDVWLKSGLPRFGKHGASHNDNTSNGEEQAG